MKNKFNKTHIQKRVGGVFIYAGYLALGSAGIGLRLPASKWSNKPKNESVDEGRGENLSPSDVDRGQLIKGIKVEYEHIGDGLKEPDDALVTRFVDGQYDNITKQDLEKLVRAQEIALDHLAELDDYYDRLEHMEGEASEAVKRYLPKAKKMTCPTCTHTEVTKDKKCPECGNVMVATKTYDQFRESK